METSNNIRESKTYSEVDLTSPHDVIQESVFLHHLEETAADL